MKKICLILIFTVFLISCGTNNNSEIIEGNMILQDPIIESVSTEKFSKLIQEKKSSSIILDVRTQNEYNSGYIEGAKLLDFYSRDFSSELSKLDKNTPYYIYCRSGNRSGKTLGMMKDLGFTHVYDLDKGIIDWSNNDLPLIK